ncbi:putative porin [Aureibaculum sp. 2210JD6-5]|uniref:putative porin n=1 Tax=Aureibaculum sp. 2210JD6-5 TaxID=3103957 RepID=UPI002AAE65C6|nr:putative porin [Aureibaculum sp. 2210JD6-5]MDY7393969.1 putative porin [Aureibaculum sp. 2210JD6-5]
MHKFVFLIFILFFSGLVFAQITPEERDFNRGFEETGRDTIDDRMIDVQLSGKTHYTDYKIISYKGDTTYVDTTLTINKDYKFNYLRKDNFELIPFHNQGQTFNSLGYDFSEVSLFPAMGNRAMHFNYYEVEDINYYKVPTPTSELAYRTGLQQGQFLDALLTFNTSERQNISIAYKGLRSLGKYRSSLSSHGNMRFTYSYQTKNDAYNIKTHITAQDLFNDQNGGLPELSLGYFETKDPNFSDRGRIETNFSDASNSLRGNRYFLAHDYKIWHRIDTAKTKESYLKVGHIFNYERKHYYYEQDAANDMFGDAFDTSIRDKLNYITLKNDAFVALKSPLVLGEVKFKATQFNYNYNYNSAVYFGDFLIPSTIKDNSISVGGSWKTNFKKFNIDVETATTVTGKLIGNYFKGSASFKQDSLFTFKGTLLTNSKSPNLNFELNQSNYINYNWSNSLKNERTRTLLFDLKSDRILNASAQITQIDNYTYFTDISTTESTDIKPFQFDKTINYLKLKVSKELRLGKFTLDNTIMYQKVAQGSSVFNVPELVTRNTLYFADHLFKGDPLYLQTGVTLKYFTAYNMNSYSPVLSEFYVQNGEKIGGYPMLDFFINAQVQRTRLYLKFEHFNSSFGKTADYYSAPTYPYRDFVIRFGLVWNFFI